MMRQLGYLFLAATVLMGCTSNKALETQKTKLTQEHNQRLEAQRQELMHENKLQLEAQRQTLMQKNESLSSDKGHLKLTLEALNQKLAKELKAKQARLEQDKATASIKLTLQQGILFPSSSYALNQTGLAVLDKVAKALHDAAGNKTIRIVGHSDNVPVAKKMHGQFIDNWDLSARRAAAVARHLIWTQGFNPENIAIVGRADVEPIASNATREGRNQNRRIELFIAQ